MFLNGGAHLRMFVAPTTAPVPPGTLSGWQLEADLNFADIYNAAGHAGQEALAMSRFNTRFAALFDKGDGSAWQARHGMTAEAYQATFDLLVRQGYRLTYVCGYSEGTEARFNAVWQLRDGPCLAGAARVDERSVSGGIRRSGAARFPAGLRQRLCRERPSAICRDLGAAGGSRLAGAARAVAEPVHQQTFDQMAADGFAPMQVTGYRVNVDVRFAAIWERRSGLQLGRPARADLERIPEGVQRANCRWLPAGVGERLQRHRDRPLRCDLAQRRAARVCRRGTGWTVRGISGSLTT